MSKQNEDEDFDMESLVDAALNGEDYDDDDEVETPKAVKTSKKKEKEIDDDDDGGSFATDPLFTELPGWKGVRYWEHNPGSRSLTINFSKFFGKDSEDYEDFIVSCVQKKAYAKMMDLFCDTANVILNNNKTVAESFMYKYYCIKRNIDHAAYDRDSYVQFSNAIVSLFDKGILNEIRKFVNSHYRETGDDKWEANRKTFVPAITFLDRHIKVMFVVSRMIHLVVPLCLEYLREYKECDAKALLADTFANLFPIAESNGEDLVPLSSVNEKMDVYQKLYSFVETKVKDTLKSDEAMWERQAFLGVNYKTTIETIVNKLVVDIVPEFAFCGNVMHMCVAVVRKSVQDYVLRRKDPYSINCLVDVDTNVSDDDNAVVTEVEQFDSFNAKHDELSIVIRHTFMEDTLNKILDRKGIILNPADVEYYMKNVRFHEFQTFAIFASNVSCFGGSENLYALNQEMYVKLMLATAQMMDRCGLQTLSRYVLGTKNRHYISRKESRLSRSLLLNDPLYQHLISNKYSNIKNVINKKSNLIEGKINCISNNEYVYNTPNEALNGRIIPRDEDQIRRDVLQFFNSFIY